MTSLLNLITVPTKTAFLTKFIELLRLAGFPVSSWHSGSLQKHTAETESDMLSELARAVQQIAKAPFIRLAKDLGASWVELNAYEVFDEEPKESLTTQGVVVITDVGGVGPITRPAGTYWVANADKSYRYVNVAAFTVPLNGAVSPLFQAESPGVDWNVGVGALTEQLTPEPGLSIANPAGANGTWITRQGTNRESVDALVQRCLDKWSTLGSGSNDAAYRYYALTAPESATDAERALWAEATRVRVYSPAPGSVRVVIAGPRGPVSASALAAIASYIDQKRPLGVWDVVTSNAVVNLVTIGGVLRVAPGFSPASVLSKAQAAIDLFTSQSPIGGTNGKMSREALIKATMVDEVSDLDGFLPATDVPVNNDEIVVPKFELIAVYA